MYILDNLDIFEIIFVIFFKELLYDCVCDVFVESFFFYEGLICILFEIFVKLFDWFFLYLFMSKEVFFRNL